MMRRFKLRKKKKDKSSSNGSDRKQEVEENSSRPVTTMATSDPSYKVILCGEYGVGKSSIFRRFLGNSYSEASTSTSLSPRSTIGLDQCTRPYTVDNTPVKLTLWDTGGMERMSFIGASYYRGAHAALLVYNRNNKDTFTILSQYILDIAMNAEGAKIFLCGNEAGGGEGKERVEEGDMDVFMTEGGDMLSGVYAVDCDTNQGLDAMFQDMARVLHTDAMQRLTLPRDIIRPTQSVPLSQETSSKKGCC